MIKTKETLIANFNETLNEFLNEANQHPRLTEQEENELLPKMSMKTEEGKEYIDKVVKANMRNIISVARLYQGYGLSASYIIHLCIFCLYEAADKYEPSMGCRFLILAYGYMHWRIQVAIRLKRQRIVDQIFNPTDESDEAIS